MPRVVTFMKVLGGAVALGSAVTIPFVISDIIARSKDKDEKKDKAREKEVTINCDSRVEDKFRGERDGNRFDEFVVEL